MEIDYKRLRQHVAAAPEFYGLGVFFKENPDENTRTKMRGLDPEFAAAVSLHLRNAEFDILEFLEKSGIISDLVEGEDGYPVLALAVFNIIDDRLRAEEELSQHIAAQMAGQSPKSEAESAPVLELAG